MPSAKQYWISIEERGTKKQPLYLVEVQEPDWRHTTQRDPDPSLKLLAFASGSDRNRAIMDAVTEAFDDR